MSESEYFIELIGQNVMLVNKILIAVIEKKEEL